jgi:site-specific recombinase XerD
MATPKAIVVRVSGGRALSTDLATLADSARKYAEDSVAKNTKRGYASDWKGFTAWCRANGLTPLPATPQVVALYFTHLANSGAAYATITRVSAAIGWVHSRHVENGKPVVVPTRDATVKTVLKGIANRIGRGTRRRKEAATIEDFLEPMVAGLADDARGHRDRAVILLGFSGAFRRSELASLRIEDVKVQDEGAVIRLRRSKTDQSGEGTDVPIPRGENVDLCPVNALQVWLDELRALGITEGFLVRGIHRSGSILPNAGATDRMVNRIVKQAAERAGLDSSELGAHSLRAGFATQAGVRGKNVLQIAAQGRWKKLDTVLGYFRVGTRFKDSAAKGIGL